MIRANIDTPWETYVQDGETVYGPKLAGDPAFADLIKPWTDQTGKEWHEWPPGSGTQVKGGNYAKDSPQGIASGKHGDPDYLTIQVKVEDEQTLIDIDNAGTDYWVYWDEVIEEDVDVPVLAIAPYKSKEGLPSASEWGQLRARLAQRGISQAWVNANLGTQRERMRSEHDFNMRHGYAVNQE